MWRKYLAAVVATGVAVGALAAVKLLSDKEEEKKSEEEENDTINFIKIEDDEEEAEAEEEAAAEEPAVEETADEESVEESEEPAEEQEEAVEETAEETEKAVEETEEKKYSAEVEEIAELYPYLTKDFIAEQFARNDAFNAEYPTDTLITIRHKAKFEDPAVLEDYAQIAKGNGYEALALSENENIISRRIFTEDGAILSDIYNVANQVNALKGVYEGYNIEA